MGGGSCLLFARVFRMPGIMDVLGGPAVRKHKRMAAPRQHLSVFFLLGLSFFAWRLSEPNALLHPGL